VLDQFLNWLIELWGRPEVQAIAGILGFVIAIASIIALGPQLWRRFAERAVQVPKEGQPIPTTGSDLERAQLIQRNRFLLQSMCNEFYTSWFGRQLAKPLEPMHHPSPDLRIPLLAAPGWIFDQPAGLSALRLRWQADVPPVEHLDGALDHRLEVELKKRKSQNRPVYRLISAEADGGTLDLAFAHDTYVGYVNTCEALLWSAASSAMNFLTAKKYTAFVPEREHAMLVANASTILTGDKYRQKVLPGMLTNRCASVGVNGLTVLRRKGTFPIFLMHRRGEVNREASGTYHVIPAGTFQPILWNDREHATEFDPNFTLLREFAEECYDDKADADGHLAASTDEIRKSHRSFDTAFRLHREGAIRTYVFGLTLDMVTLKPELLTLVLADAGRLKADFGEFREQYEGIRVEEPFDKRRIEDLLSHGSQERVLAAAMGCLALAHKNFDFIMEQLDGLPE
jgi:hypothetical protein